MSFLLKVSLGSMYCRHPLFRRNRGACSNRDQLKRLQTNVLLSRGINRVVTADNDDMVGQRRPRRDREGEPPGIRIRRNDPNPQEYIVQEQHPRNAPFDHNSPCFTPSRRTTRATIRVNHSLDRRGQNIASLAIEDRAQALRRHRELFRPVIFEGPIFHIDDGLVPDINPIY